MTDPDEVIKSLQNENGNVFAINSNRKTLGEYVSETMDENPEFFDTYVKPAEKGILLHIDNDCPHARVVF